MMEEMPANMTLQEVLTKMIREGHQGHLQDRHGHDLAHLPVPVHHPHLQGHNLDQGQDHLLDQKEIEKEVGSLGQGNSNKGYMVKVKRSLSTSISSL